MQENNQNPLLENDLQNEINSFIKTTPDVSTAQQTEQIAPQVVDITAPVNQTQEPVQTPQVVSSDKVYSQSNNKIVLILVAIIIGLAIGGANLIIKGQGAKSFEDCIKIAENTTILLEPAYCVNKKGNILYKNFTDEEIKEKYESDGPSDYESFETPLP